MTDPFIFLFWVFIIATVFVFVFVFGRGLFCGWMCPFGSLQEIIYKLAHQLGLKRWQFKLPQAWHDRLKWLKYALFFGLLVVSMFSMGLAEVLSEVEPFKTTFLVGITHRPWPYGLFVVVILGLSIFVERPYCKYICPLGGALAMLAGLAGVGGVLWWQFGAAGLFHYAGFVVSALLLGLAFLSLAVSLSVVARDRTRASGLAIMLWFFFVLVFDLLLLGALVATGGQYGGEAFPYPLLLNPADVFRILNVFSMDDMRSLYGLTSIVPPALANPGLMGAVMLTWIVAPLGLANWRFKP